MTKLEKKLLTALIIFTDCPNWRRFVHDMDCTDTDGHMLDADARDCRCDGPYYVEIIESALKVAGSPIKHEEGW